MSFHLMTLSPLMVQSLSQQHINLMSSVLLLHHHGFQHLFQFHQLKLLFQDLLLTDATLHQLLLHMFLFHKFHLGFHHHKSLHGLKHQLDKFLCNKFHHGSHHHKSLHGFQHHPQLDQLMSQLKDL